MVLLNWKWNELQWSQNLIEYCLFVWVLKIKIRHFLTTVICNVNMTRVGFPLIIFTNACCWIFRQPMPKHAYHLCLFWRIVDSIIKGIIKFKWFSVVHKFGIKDSYLGLLHFAVFELKLQRSSKAVCIFRRINPGSIFNLL